MIQIEALERKWHADYQKFRSAIEHHRISFILTQECKCKSRNCRHYREERKELFSNMIDRLLVQGVTINTLAHNRFIKFQSKP
jgi:hypothetical protein